jgi:phosphohistidine phosphatase
MDLILWRHAEAFDAAAGERDSERALTPKGERQAERVAAWLNRHLPQGTQVLASPARRAQQTAAALGHKVRTVPALGTGASVEAFLQAVGWPYATGAVLVVGHQPTLGLVAAQLVGGTPQSWSVRKGAVWWLHARERSGSGRVTLNAVVSPDLL